MEKELKIIPPIGYEIDRQKSTFLKIVFKKIPENPKTWEEYCKLMKGKTMYYTNCNTITVSGFSDAHDKFVNKKRAEQFIALGKLLQLRDYWVKGYDKFSYFVCNDSDRRVFVYYFDSVNPYPLTYPLTFPTKEMAEEFKDCFEDLIKQAFTLV